MNLCIVFTDMPFFLILQLSCIDSSSGYFENILDQYSCVQTEINTLCTNCLPIAGVYHNNYGALGMLHNNELMDKLQNLGVGRRKLKDKLFSADEMPPRLGVYDEEELDVCHQTITSRLACTIPGCVFNAESLLDLENHYNASHRYSCKECRRVLPSPHLLDLHLQETHDSFFAVMAAKKPSYCCYIKECTNKFVNSAERRNHCIQAHKLPKDFRFEIKSKCLNKSKKKNTSQNVTMPMDVDGTIGCQKTQQYFHNSKQKGVIKYSGKKFTSDKTSMPSNSSTTLNMDELMSDLKENLPK